MSERERYRTIRLTTKGKPTKRKTLAKKVIGRAKKRFSIEGAGGLNAITTWNNHDPLWANRAAAGHKKGVSTRPPGWQAGMKMKTYLRYVADGKREARKILRYMTDKKMFVPDNDVSEEAFKVVLEVLRAPAHARDKLAAAKTLLEYTQRKPVAASEMTLNSAESFLDAILAEEKKERDEARASGDAEEVEGELSPVCEACPENPQ